MDEHQRPNAGQGTQADRTSSIVGGEAAANDERPLFASLDDDDAATRVVEESRADLALRGAATVGALGGNAGLAAGALTGFGGALGVNSEAGEPVEVEDEDLDR